MFEGLFQPMHLLVILGIALLVFGPKKLPELGKGLGDAIRGFKESLNQPAAPAPPQVTTHSASVEPPSAPAPSAPPKDQPGSTT